MAIQIMKLPVFKEFVVILSLSITFPAVYAQNYTHPKQIEITPPPPSAAALTKFGDMPVGLATGLPHISIPIYQYEDKTSGLRLNASFDYHAGGVRVEEIASNVGIGWALNAGGVITRTVRGIHDEAETYGFLNTSIPANETEGNSPLDYVPMRPFNNIAASVRDGQNDLFSFNFNGRSGQFSFGRNNDILFNSTEKLKVTKQVGTVSGTASLISKITVVDEHGVTYVFGAPEKMTTLGSVWPGSKHHTSAWYLTEIISPINNEKILLTYESFGISQYTSGSTLTSYQDVNSTKQFNTISTYAQSFQGKRLKKISFPNAVVMDFTYHTTQRTDLPGDKMLSKISITDGTNKRGFVLNQDYSLNKATLKKVTPFQGTSETLDRPYEFTYFTSGSTLPIRDSSIPDHWGYFIGNSVSSRYAREIFPEGTGWGYELSGGNRDTHPTYVKVGSLQKIKYPTGGYTLFEMEANKADHPWLRRQFTVGGTTYSHIQDYVGGLRVKKITDYDGVSSTPALTKEYEYLKEDGVTSSGTLGIYPTYTFLVWYGYNASFGEDSPGYTPSHHYVLRSSSSAYEMVYAAGSPVTYARVTEKRTVGGISEGKTISTFTTASSTISTQLPFTPPDNKSWGTGLLKEEEVYNKTGTLIRKTVNEYESKEDLYYTNPTRAENFRSISIIPVEFHLPPLSTDNDFTPLAPPFYFKMRSYLPPSGKANLISTDVYDYTPEGTFHTHNGYSYDPVFLYKKTDTVTTSRETGVKYITRYLYPKDMVSAGRDPQNVYQGMINKNIINPVIEEIQFVNSGQLYLGRTNYYQPYTGLYVPQSVVTKKNTATDDSRFEYQHNNKGRIIKAKMTSGPSTSYIWDYFDQYPVAEVKNAEQADIAYASFEADGKGNWAYTGANILDPAAPVGRRRYALSNGSMSKSGLTPSRKYVLEYWVKNAAHPTISGSGLQVGTAELLYGKEGWTLYRRSVTGVATLTLSGQSVVIDEVRLYPADAQMTTYTYEPLVGMTSMTKTTGQTFYYKYDAAQRLSSIRDLSGHLVESYCYNYAGQQVDCNPTVYSSVAKSGTFTRSNCPSGQTGSQVTYTVPAGSYTSTVSQADADAQAQADVNANGQAHANANGTCTLANVTFYIVRDMSWSSGQVEQLDFWKDGNIVETIYPTNTQSTETYQVAANNYDYVDAHIINPPGATPFDVYFNFTGSSGGPSPCEQVNVAPYTQIIRLDNVDMTGTANHFWIAEYCR